MVELVVVVAVMCVLAAIFLPKWVKQQARNSSRISCSNNLKMIGLAFKTWSLDSADDYPMQRSLTNGGTMELVGAGNVWPHFLVMSNELTSPKIVFCPGESDRQRSPANTFMPEPQKPAAFQIPLTNDSHISYFVGVDAGDIYPQMILAGDHNLSIGGKPAGHGLHSIWTNASVNWIQPMHYGSGNVLLADGSVQAVANSNWHPILIQTGFATNRLALP